MAYAERIHPPLSRNMLTEELNRIRPALSRDSLPDMRESVMPALSDRLLNAPEATSAPQHHQAQQIPPRPPMPEHPTMRMVQPPMPNRTPAPTLQVSSQPIQPTVQPTPRRMPPMLMPVARGQKTALRLQESGCARIRFGFGWMRTIPDAMWMRRRFCWAKTGVCCLMKGLCSTDSRRQATAVSAFSQAARTIGRRLLLILRELTRESAKSFLC